MTKDLSTCDVYKGGLRVMTFKKAFEWGGLILGSMVCVEFAKAAGQGVPFVTLWSGVGVSSRDVWKSPSPGKL